MRVFSSFWAHGPPPCRALSGGSLLSGWLVRKRHRFQLGNFAVRHGEREHAPPKAATPSAASRFPAPAPFVRECHPDGLRGEFRLYREREAALEHDGGARSGQLTFAVVDGNGNVVKQLSQDEMLNVVRHERRSTSNSLTPLLQALAGQSGLLPRLRTLLVAVESSAAPIRCWRRFTLFSTRSWAKTRACWRR